jgi:hypothetical protein
LIEARSGVPSPDRIRRGGCAEDLVRGARVVTDISDVDCAHYRRRLAEEKARAFAAISPAAKAAQRRLAALYWEKL